MPKLVTIEAFVEDYVTQESATPDVDRLCTDIDSIPGVIAVQALFQEGEEVNLSIADAYADDLEARGVDRIAALEAAERKLGIDVDKLIEAEYAPQINEQEILNSLLGVTDPPAALAPVAPATITTESERSLTVDARANDSVALTIPSSSLWTSDTEIVLSQEDRVALIEALGAQVSAPVAEPTEV